MFNNSSEHWDSNPGLFKNHSDLRRVSLSAHDGHDPAADLGKGSGSGKAELDLDAGVAVRDGQAECPHDPVINEE